MLTHLHIQNFTLVESLDLELNTGLTAITGETGAGKSIMLDALGLALGDRADAEKVREGEKKTEIHASFDISNLAFAQKWLKEQELEAGSECILRRIVTNEGRSRAYINGHTVTLPQLRQLGDMLVDIHSQHEHQSLLKSDTHRRLLDEFGKHTALDKDVKMAYKTWRDLEDRRQNARNQTEEMNARYQLLRYQVEELDQLALQPNELEELEAQQAALANAEGLRQNCLHVASICGADEDGLRDRLQRAIRLLQELSHKPTHLSDAESMLSSALIQIEEAQLELDRYLDSEEDLSLLPEVEQRLSDIYQVARKHRVAPDDLVGLHQQLTNELQGLRSGDEHIEVLDQECQSALSTYSALAKQLSAKREKTAQKLVASVNKKLQLLAMPHAKLSIELNIDTSQPKLHGNESPEFLISTNPGQPPKPLAKIASGGELSRVSLAIQVVTAQTSTVPTLVFDEVDVGIGGETGDVVGRMLRELGNSAQVLCVTHLAQVASKGHHHLQVSKQMTNNTTLTQVMPLKGQDIVAEIARMMGGAVDSKKSLAHAKEMLAEVS